MWNNNQPQQWNAGGPPPPGPASYAPQQNYGYGAPPAAPYGQPGGYGQPQAYNAPPHSQPSWNSGPQGPGAYGQPSVYGQQNGYPTPAQTHMNPSAAYGVTPTGPPPASTTTGPFYYLGVSIPAPPPAPPVTPASLPGYDANFDASRIRGATKGFGTNEKALITVLSGLDAWQMELLSRVFEGSYGRSLQKTLEKELSGWLENGLVLLSLGPLGGDIHLMHRACAGAGTHEDLLTELIMDRTNQEIWLLKEGYKTKYGKDLTQVIKGELSMKTERLFIMALAGTRDESPVVNHQLVEQDVQALYRAGEGRMGTDEIAICSIMTQRSPAHLVALSQAYQAKHRHTLVQATSSEFSGHMREALLHVAKAYASPNGSVERDAELLESAMAGAGTKDERLIYRIVRGHWNKPRWQSVQVAYRAMYGRDLSRRVKGETTGKYETMLVAMCD